MAHYSIKSAMDRVRTLQEALGAVSSLKMEDAAQHLVDGTPAYGWTCQYHNQPACIFTSAVVRLGSVEAAIEELTPFFTMHGKPFNPEPLMQYLLPLNAAAVRDLKLAYENGGSWVTSEELERRTENVRIRSTNLRTPFIQAEVA